MTTQIQFMGFKMPISKFLNVLFISAIFFALSACLIPIENEIIEPAPRSTYESEPHQGAWVDFSNVSANLQIVRTRSPYRYPKGTLIVDPNEKFIYLMENDEFVALRYPIAVGREGEEWYGTAQIARKTHWPVWRPTPDMREENPNLPELVEGGTRNPLGARSLYLYSNGQDTLYRIHGTNSPNSIGSASSSGCIRMFNEHVIDLYNRVPIGTKVVVLPLKNSSDEEEEVPNFLETVITDISEHTISQPLEVPEDEIIKITDS